MTTAAQAIARHLAEAGCRHAFGIPGGEVLTLMDALAEAGIAFTLAKHENAAGFMAEGAWHATGAPGVLLATIGPGVANTVNVVANAQQDRVPLIVLSGCVDPADVHTYTHQVFDHRAVLGPVAKATFTVSAGAADVVARKALAIACEGQPGPVLLDVPIGVAGAEEPDRSLVASPRVPRPAPAEGPDLEEARRLLATARRPILIAGLEVLQHDASDTVARLARDHGIPVVTTYKAKGVLPEDDPLCLGGAGLSPRADKILLPLVDQADLVLLAGYDPIEMRIGWRDPWGPDKAVVSFEAAPNPHGMHVARLSFVGDLGRGIEALRDGVPPANATWPEGEPAAARAALGAAFPVDEAWGPAAVVDSVRRALPADGVATVDSGAHRILLSQCWTCATPRTLLQSTGLCTVGCALPLAVGYKLAAPDRPVVAFTGDAGLEMVLGELATLRDLALPVVVVVFVDQSLALIELKQRGSALDNVGVDFAGTDFAAVARALGGVGVVAEDRHTLESAVGEGLGATTFTVIACPIGRKAYDGRF